MKYLIAIPAVLAVAACADSGAHYQPIQDGQPTAALQSDLAACQALARDQRQFDQETLGAAVLGAGAGAVLGEVDAEGDALGGAIVGALAGGTAGAVDANKRRQAHRHRVSAWSRPLGCWIGGILWQTSFTSAHAGSMRSIHSSQGQLMLSCPKPTMAQTA